MPRKTINGQIRFWLLPVGAREKSLTIVSQHFQKPEAERKIYVIWCFPVSVQWGFRTGDGEVEETHNHLLCYERVLLEIQLFKQPKAIHSIVKREKEHLIQFSVKLGSIQSEILFI